jgi:hypothetical protein
MVYVRVDDESMMSLKRRHDYDELVNAVPVVGENEVMTKELLLPFDRRLECCNQLSPI